MQETIFGYIKKKYAVLPEYPWQKYDNPVINENKAAAEVSSGPVYLWYTKTGVWNICGPGTSGYSEQPERCIEEINMKNGEHNRYDGF